MNESLNATEMANATVVGRGAVAEAAKATGVYHVICTGPVEHLRGLYCQLRDAIARMVDEGLAGSPKWFEATLELAAIPLERKWADEANNVVTDEGRRALLTHGFKGSTYTASQVMGLISDDNYTAVADTNTAADLTTGSGTPANGWNEAASGVLAAREVPSFGTASGDSLAVSPAVSMSIVGTDTIKGVFLMMRSTAGTAPSTTVGNTNGALYSAGLFSGGDKPVGNGDTLAVTYTASL